jgi:hypothetical protein
MKKKTAEGPFLKYLPVFIGVFSFLMGVGVHLVSGMNSFYHQFASIPYVDEKYSQSLNYTNAKFQQALDHSDLNRAQIMQAIESQTSSIREQGALIRETKEWLMRIADGHSEGPRKR